MAVGRFSIVDQRTGITRPMTAAERAVLVEKKRRKKMTAEERRLANKQRKPVLEEKRIRRLAKKAGGDALGRDINWWRNKWLEIKSRRQCEACGKFLKKDQLLLIHENLDVCIVRNRRVDIVRACSKKCQEKAWNKFKKEHRKLALHLYQTARHKINILKKQKRQQRLELHQLKQQLDLLSIREFIEQCLPPSQAEPILK